MSPSALPLIGAHRGAWDAKPQNSVAAFLRAVDLGANLVEMDVRAAAGGRLVVVHDPWVAGEPVDRLTVERLGAVAPRVPLLEEALAALSGRVVVNLEVKVPGVEKELLTVLRRFPACRLLISSFLPGVVEALRRLVPSIPTGLVADRGDPDGLARYCREAGHRALFLHHSLLPPPGALAAGPDLYTWTVNGSGALSAALSRGDLAGIITDEPVRALALRRELTRTGYNGPRMMISRPVRN